MLTPDGKHCPYYYVNTHRQANETALCHLLQGQADALRWNPTFCITCPVPKIKQANGCENLRLHARVGKRKWHFWEKEHIIIHATCVRTGNSVKNPYVGCGQCHHPIVFVVKDPNLAQPEAKRI